VLYGCLELARRVRGAGHVPPAPDFADAPKFRLRGPNIGMQKTAITYDGAMYDYRYRPEEFGVFYDRQLWTRYLDFLLENRMNTLHLWNGHPFTVSHALAKARGLPFQHTTPTEFTSRYTRYCIAEFIRAYPNAGLMMTLGEALSPQYGPQWLAETIIPGIKDGMRSAGLSQEPPIVVRAHATRIEEAMARTLPRRLKTSGSPCSATPSRRPALHQIVPTRKTMAERSAATVVYV
jgi:hypothetical protein